MFHKIKAFLGIFHLSIKIILEGKKGENGMTKCWVNKEAMKSIDPRKVWKKHEKIQVNFGGSQIFWDPHWRFFRSHVKNSYFLGENLWPELCCINYCNKCFTYRLSLEVFWFASVKFTTIFTTMSSLLHNYIQWNTEINYCMGPIKLV